jgi:sulfur carrier protein ThiS
VGHEAVQRLEWDTKAVQRLEWDTKAVQRGDRTTVLNRVALLSAPEQWLLNLN